MSATAAFHSSSGEGTGIVRFGSFALQLEPDQSFWAGVMLRRFRATPRPQAGVAVDMVLRIRAAPEARPSILEGDALRVERQGDRARVWCDMMTLDVDFAARPATSLLRVHDGGAGEPLLEHCFAVFLHKLLQMAGVVRLHAAAVETPVAGGRTVVMLGDKGAGKSTLSLAFGRAGARVLADDQVVLRRRGDSVVISGCDGNVRLTEQSERHFVDEPLAAEAQNFGGVWKKEVRLDRLVNAMPYCDRRAARLYFPRVGSRFALEPVGRTAALIRILDAISPAHGFDGPSDRMDLVRLVTEFVASLDCFDLELSSDLAELDRVVDAVWS